MIFQATVAPVGLAGVPCSFGLLTSTSSAHGDVDVAAQADIDLLGANPQAISAAIEASERTKMLLRNMIILPFVSLDTGVPGEPALRKSRPRLPARRLVCVAECYC